MDAGGYQLVVDRYIAQQGHDGVIGRLFMEWVVEW